MTQDEIREIRNYFDGKFELLEKRLDRRFDGVDKRFDGVDKRLDRMEATMEREFGAITTQFVELRGYIDDAHERTSGRMEVQFEALRADMKITREHD